MEEEPGMVFEIVVTLISLSLSGNIHKYDDICLVSLSTVR